MKKPKITAEKPAVKTKATKQTVKNKAVKATPKKPSPAKPASKKTKVEAPKLKPVSVAPKMDMPDRVGSTAGNIWHYLNDNGATSVAKLLRELTEEDKVIQRSIGWLAQEDKISLDIVNRVEIIALKG